MSTDRPTFSESWHRVADTRPRLRPSVRCYRQQFRGQLWHVFGDAANNSFFRADDAGYHFIALLNGRRSVAEAWALANEELGDRAPTQGEVIQLLGQLHAHNLLQAELPPDAEQVFRRYSKRVSREVRGYLSNFLFIRIPLFDPNAMLQRWAPLFGWLFSPVGIALWAVLLATAGYFLVGRWGELIRGADPQLMLSFDRMLSLYACFVVIKAVHEFGHGFACAHFGRRSGIGGPVHTVGIMLLVFAPVPYVDASSSWAFRNKWQRAFVGAAGMYVELALAAVAAIVWAHTAGDTLVNTLAYNVIFVAGVSTLLFNANPLLRFDGYYILADLLEMANLAQRSKQYLQYLARRYAFAVARTTSPAHTPGERPWLAFYGVASFIYRVFICVGILLYIANVLFVVGLLLAVAAVVMWVVVPIGKFIRYLAIDPELERSRGRAVAVSAMTVAAILVPLGVVPVPEHGRAEGVIEPVRLATVHIESEGFVDSILPSGTAVEADARLITAHNRELEAEYASVQAQIRAARIRRDLAREEDPAAVQALAEQMAALQHRARRFEQQLDALQVHAPWRGVWISEEAGRLGGVYLQRGQRIGMVADPSQLIVRVAADQRLGPRLGEDVSVELRVRGRPDVHFRGDVQQVAPAGQQELPSAALGYVAGGSLRIAQDDPEGRRAADPFFEVHIRPDIASAGTGDDGGGLWIGQRVVARFALTPRPLLAQWFHWGRQVLQQRLGAI